MRGVLDRAARRARRVGVRGRQPQPRRPRSRRDTRPSRAVRRGDARLRRARRRLRAARLHPAQRPRRALRRPRPRAVDPPRQAGGARGAGRAGGRRARHPGRDRLRHDRGAAASLGRAARYAEWRRVADDRPVVELGHPRRACPGLGTLAARGARRRAGVAARRRDDRAVGAVRHLARRQRLPDVGGGAGRRGRRLPRGASSSPRPPSCTRPTAASSGSTCGAPTRSRRRSRGSGRHWEPTPTSSCSPC